MKKNLFNPIKRKGEKEREKKKATTTATRIVQFNFLFFSRVCVCCALRLDSLLFFFQGPLSATQNVIVILAINRALQTKKKKAKKKKQSYKQEQ